jgi:hypothetical protein
LVVFWSNFKKEKKRSGSNPMKKNRHFKNKSTNPHTLKITHKKLRKVPDMHRRGLELIFVATKSKISSSSIWKLIAGWDRTDWKTLIDFIQSIHLNKATIIYGKFLGREELFA